jgi:hypothetical protein
MTIPEETLMAYADGELDAAARSEVEAAMAADPEVAQRVARHQALRKKISSEFDPVLLETVPESLVSAVHAAPIKSSAEKPSREATVTDLRRVRAARAAEAKEAAASARRATPPVRPWSWFEWAAMAASLAAGAVIAHLVLKSPDAERLGTRDGQLVAQGDLDQALSNQLAGDQAESAPVHIGVSFKSKAGDHCRTFVVKGPSPMGGLACRKNEAWAVEVLAAAEPSAGAGGYRPAASMPPAVVTAVEQQIQGEPLDASAEAAARASKWQ